MSRPTRSRAGHARPAACSRSLRSNRCTAGRSGSASARCRATSCRSATARSIRRCTSSSNEGWVKAEWKPTENNRRAKFYALTRAGRRQLENETASWDRLVRGDLAGRAASRRHDMDRPAFPGAAGGCGCVRSFRGGARRQRARRGAALSRRAPGRGERRGRGLTAEAARARGAPGHGRGSSSARRNAATRAASG